MSRKLLLAAFIFACLRVVAQDSSRTTALDAVVITANKYPKKQTETGKVLTVITRDQLDKSGGKTLAEVLNNVSGITIVGSQGSLGTNLAVSIRGATAGNVLVLLDGIPINDPSVITNYFDLNFISADQVERVEILKGGQSTLYGSDAVAGVINIITRKPKGEGVHADLSASAGSYGTYKADIGLNQNFEGSAVSLRYGYTTSEGFSSAYDSTGNAHFDNDGYRQHNVTGTWKVSLTNKLAANVSGIYSRYKTDIDAGGFKDEKDYTVTTDNFQGGAGLSYRIPEGLLQFNYRYNTVKRLYLDDSVFNAPDYLRSAFEGRTHFLELYGNKKWKHVELLAGADYRQNNMSSGLISVSAFGPYSSNLADSVANMSQVSPYASVVLKANKTFNIELGGRWNSHSEYGNNFTYTINPSAFIHERLKLFANFYSAFKAPTLYQLFDPFTGNTGLAPEKSFNAEGGAQLFIANNADIRAVYFYRDTKDAIEFIYTDPANFISHYQNVSNKKAKGIELEANFRGEKWNASANYTYMDGRLRTGFDNAGYPIGKDSSLNNLFRNPASVFNLSGGLQVLRKLYAGTAVHIAGRRFEPVYAGSPVELGGYYTVDLNFEYRASSKCRLYAAFRNVTDQKYFEVLGYNTRRFNFTGGLQVSL